MTKRKLHDKDKIISPLIAQRQSPYQIIVDHPELDMSVRTLYHLIDLGVFTAKNIDLKRQTKFKPRRVHKMQIKNRSVFINRTYDDFTELGLTIKCFCTDNLISGE